VPLYIVTTLGYARSRGRAAAARHGDPRGGRFLTNILVALLLGSTPTAHAYGIETRIAPRAWLHMPQRADGGIPQLLSQTGAFLDTRRLVPAAGLIPYDLVVSFWSDGASKRRWIAVPAGKINFSSNGEWSFPPGTVFVKTFELSIDDAHPQIKRRLETRLLVCDADGGVYGVVYKWRADNSDADLISTGLVEQIPIKSVTGEPRQQSWYYPSRKDCLECHNTRAGGVLGVKTRQMNRSFTYPSGVMDNQLRTWNHLGLFDRLISENEIANFTTLAASDDGARSLEDRARSYLDANCAQCHRPGGTVAYFDARYDTPLSQQLLIDGTVLIDQGIDRPRIISPHDIWRSIAYMRVNTQSEIKMPPLARETIDENGVELLRQWILSLPGRDVLSPPIILPAGGTFDHPIEITITDKDPNVDIRYTLDGSTPGNSDLHYAQPIELTAPTVLRARAFKPGYTRSITAQEAFIVGR
jgi:uncharacterized repeat protein (TIGR03806 family)